MDIIPHFKHILTVAGIYLTTAIPVSRNRGRRSRSNRVLQPAGGG